MNTSGVHIPLWVVGDNPLLGWGLSSDYPDEEGSFFGNIFVSPPKAFYCNGKDFDVGVVPGRLGAGLGNAPYSNPFGGTGYCRDNCTPADAKPGIRASRPPLEWQTLDIDFHAPKFDEGGSGTAGVKLSKNLPPIRLSESRRAELCQKFRRSVNRKSKILATGEGRYESSKNVPPARRARAARRRRSGSTGFISQPSASERRAR